MSRLPERVKRDLLPLRQYRRIQDIEEGCAVAVAEENASDSGQAGNMAGCRGTNEPEMVH